MTTPHAADARRGICLSPFTVDGHAVAVATLADRSVVGTVVLRPGVSQAVAYDVLTLLLELADPVRMGEQTPKAPRHLQLVTPSTRPEGERIGQAIRDGGGPCAAKPPLVAAGRPRAESPQSA